MDDHRHAEGLRYRRILRHIAGDCYLVLGACRCGATRQEVIRDKRGMPQRGKLIEAGPWEEPKEKRGLDMDKLAKGLGAKRKGKVSAGAGYPGAMQTAAEVAANIPPKDFVLELANGGKIVSEGEEYETGAMVRVISPDGKELGCWYKDEWVVDPEQVMGAILRMAAVAHTWRGSPE